MTQPRLKSSFIYLGNAVNDLRGNWLTLAIGLAPLALLAAVCLLPDALNLQHLLADRFTPGTRHVAWLPIQEPYAPSLADTAPLFPPWAISLFHLMVLILAFAGELVVLCAVRRMRSGALQEPVATAVIAIWQDSVKLLPAFFWVVILHLAVPFVALFILRIYVVGDAWLALLLYLLDVVLIVLAPTLYLWLYFAEYALAFDGKHSFHALLFSRDLMRKRFFRVATRVVVFLAVWSGYDSWAAAVFFVVSLILGPVGVLTGYFWAVIFLVEFAAVATTYVTMAFFVAASARLYQDLVGDRAEQVVPVQPLPAPAPLASVDAQA
ncbi:MAG TPA: hypothetical protein VKS22_06280 [Candidatus Binataceae bacterium]|nr:hypothetical protein [Candidatus Binataceae bacterium]